MPWSENVFVFCDRCCPFSRKTGSFSLQLFSIVCIRCLDQSCCWSQWWRNNAVCSLCVAASSATIRASTSPGWPGCGSATPHRFWHQVRHDLTTYCTQWHFSNFPSYFYFRLSNLTPGCSFSAVSHTNNNVRTQFILLLCRGGMISCLSSGVSASPAAVARTTASHIHISVNRLS